MIIRVLITLIEWINRAYRRHSRHLPLFRVIESAFFFDIADVVVAVVVGSKRNDRVQIITLSHAHVQVTLN